MKRGKYTDAVDPSLVGTYAAVAGSGGGYVWDEVSEYRVWCHPERGAPDDQEGNDYYYYAYSTYAQAVAASASLPGAEQPLALIRQGEYIAEDQPGVYRHVREERKTEWPVEFLVRPRRTPDTIPRFFAPDAPANRLEILRGLVDELQ
jgi:putative acetyltransferase